MRGRQTIEKGKIKIVHTGDSFLDRLKQADSGLCKFFLLITLVFIVAGLLLVAVMWISTSNRLNYYEFAVTMTEKRVRPPVPPEDLIIPAPFLYGEFDIDETQSEVRWKIYHQFGDGLPHPPGSLDIRGPLKQGKDGDGDDDDDDDYRGNVAPVVIGLGLGKDSKGRYSGILDIEEKLLVDILQRRYVYYISMSDTHGREIARDLLTKVSTSLV